MYEGEGDGKEGDGDIGWAGDCHQYWAKERRQLYFVMPAEC